jgi:REP element-mobilizing transposase RayT
MTQARKTLISLNDTPYYHVVARCVRRAWLWGFDEYAGRDYSHRKVWVLERLDQLSSIFTIDICAYAVMSNHYHLVLHVDRGRAKQLSTEDVVSRWTAMFSVPPVVARWQKGTAIEVERRHALAMIERWRMRLYDISWFMKYLNEHLARRANAEDNCSGRFWESRFKSQALLDEASLLTAMAYVDLNPVRAGIAATPEDSEFTSIYQRIREMREAPSPENESEPQPQIPLMPFQAGHASVPVLPYRLQDYLLLVDWTGRVIREGPENCSCVSSVHAIRGGRKRGAIDSRLPSIIQRLNIDADAWQVAMRPRGNVFGRAMGRLDHLRLHAKTLGQSWIKGLRAAEALYN